jgi:predicted 2-oxoglutarate/Fe(II)-dependent dioxygenase YbiX
MKIEKIEDAIVVLEKRVPDAFCDIIIKYVNHINEFERKGTMGDTEKRKLDKRNVVGYSFNNNKITDRIFYQHLNNVINTNYINYKFKFPQIRTHKLKQADILKYEAGGKYDVHVDHGFQCERTLSVILNLNEDYEGGDFVFFYQDGKTEMKRVSCKKGTVIMFPSTFLYPHAVEPITKGVRYSIVSWLL